VSASAFTWAAAKLNGSASAGAAAVTGTVRVRTTLVRCAFAILVTWGMHDAPKRPAQEGPGLLDYASKMARTLVTGRRQIGHNAPTNRGAHPVHRQRWPHGEAAIVDCRSKHTTHIGSVPTGVSCTTTRSLSPLSPHACTTQREGDS
jgi:hypothetical protein